MATDELQLGLEALELAASRAERKRLIEKLVPIAVALADRAGQAGITVANLRHAAVRQGLLPQIGTARELSFLGAVMKRAKLVPTSRTRRSNVVRSHGNQHRVWVAPREVQHYD